MQIKVGDRIHHPRHGLGRVLGTCRRRFGGDEAAVFTQLHFRRNGLTVMIREDELATAALRPPLDATTARRVLGRLAKSAEPRGRDWKARAKTNAARLQRGDALACADIIRELATFRDANGQLSLADREHLSQATELLAEELGHALDTTVAEASEMIAERSGIELPGTPH